MTKKKIVCELDLNGMSPQKAIRHLTDIISRAKISEKRRLRIESYMEDYGHPFREGTKEYRVVIDGDE